MTLLLLVVLGAPFAQAQDSLRWSGFAFLRGASHADGLPLDENQTSAQVQLGLDWQPSIALGAHLHLLARDDGDDARRGRVGVVQAYLEQRVRDRWRFTEGAFFLPTSRENVDALWESPYTITPSALNSWFGEEFRPIGVDAAYTWRRTVTVGATVFRGNDTLGAIPVDRGWGMRDEWILLGEHRPVGDGYYTSASAETDGTLGWAARGRWQNQYATAQLTYIDNRSDADEHGELLNWATRFYIAAAEVNRGDWTLAAESGWGHTRVFEFPSPIRAAYVLVSRRLANGRVSLRGDTFNRGHALTAAFFWSPRGHLRTGVEVIRANDDTRVAVELRYHFAGR
ncbi:MAG TPA: hypothetical protein VJ276_18780 [Thermoanaerobaculia bacterium]|nr:hypothetical protein [Thermoanaerobaculia bacterium]